MSEMSYWFVGKMWLAKVLMRWSTRLKKSAWPQAGDHLSSRRPGFLMRTLRHLRLRLVRAWQGLMSPPDLTMDEAIERLTHHLAKSRQFRKIRDGLRARPMPLERHTMTQEDALSKLVRALDKGDLVRQDELLTTIDRSNGTPVGDIRR